MLTIISRSLGIGVLLSLLPISAQEQGASPDKTPVGIPVTAPAEPSADRGTETEAVRSQLEAELGELRRKSEDLTAERNRLQAELETVRQESDRLQSRLKTTEQTLTAAHQERDRLNGQLNAAKTAQDQLQNELEQARQEKETLTQTVSQLQSQLEAVRQELAETRQALDTTRQEHTNLGVKLKDTEAELEKARHRTYTVKPGDSLSSIAQRLYGDPDRWTEILEANRDTLTNPDALESGMVLKIP